MRIIGGEFRSRRLLTPSDTSTTRPIPDRVKESLFGLLRGHTEGVSVFDAFAGTGSIGLEAVSRGADRCVFVERDRKMADILRQNIREVGAEDRCEVVVGDALGPGALARCPRPVHLVFLDPPYPLVQGESGWNRVRAQLERLVDLLTDDGFAMVRTPWPFMIEPAAEGELAEPERPRRKSERREREGKKGSRRGGSDLDDPQDEAAAEEPRPLVAPDMKLANAEGPETHTYQTMAVHLYARRKPSAG